MEELNCELVMRVKDGPRRGSSPPDRQSILSFGKQQSEQRYQNSASEGKYLWTLTTRLLTLHIAAKRLNKLPT